jgi:murein DD-endopeptidase MepM/ murein hydrolase activator NlpD
MSMKRIAMVLLAFVLSLTATPAMALPALPDLAVAPVDGPVVRGFDPPELDWLPGHRGIDFAVAPGATVRAAAAGTVTSAGRLAGRGVVVVSHGSVRTTYEPVDPIVAVGQKVHTGTPIGTAVTGHADCPAPACLHWGLKQGDDYLDPLLLLAARTSEVRLLPEGSEGALADRMAESESTFASTALMASARSDAALRHPVNGPITSPFGMRVDPITGTWRLHSGTDFGAVCGTPILAAAAGVVRSVTWHPSYGNRLVLVHETADGVRLTTAYNHASGYIVRAGQRVAAGQVIGSVGTTGDSTGCHLHFMVYADDRLADPMTYLTGR